MEKTKFLKFLKLQNIAGLGIESAGKIEFQFSKGVNVILGPNESGKSRLIKVIKTLLSDRMKIGWLRTNDSGSSEMQCFFSDGTKINVDIAEDGKADRIIKDDNGLEVKRLDFLSNVSSLAMDPSLFFDDKNWTERIKIVVEALGLKITKKDWIVKVGKKYLPQDVSFDENAIDQFNSGENFYVDERKKENRVVSEYNKTIENLERTVPDNIEIDFVEKINEIDKKLQKSNDDQQKEQDTKLSKLRSDVSTLNFEIAELVKKIETLKGTRQVIVEKGETLKAEIENNHQKSRAILNQQKEVWKTEQENAKKSQVTLELIKQNKKTLTEHEVKAEKLNDLVDIVRTWRKKSIEKNPIPGLSVGKKDLLVDGKPWEVVNTGKMVEIYLKILDLIYSKMSTDDLIPMVICDNFESIDNTIREKLVPLMIEKGMQLIFCEVHPSQGNFLKILDHFPEKIIKE